LELSPKLYHWFVRPKWYTYRYARIYRELLRGIDFKEKTVLDFGCGIGSNCILFNPKFYMGVDKDRLRINYAKKLFPKYKFSTVPGINLEFENNSVNYILIIAVLHHISCHETAVYLEEFRRILKPDGKVILIEPCLIKNRYINNLVMHALDRGKYIRDMHGYLNILEEYNYRVITKNTFCKCMFYNELFLVATPL